MVIFEVTTEINPRWRWVMSNQYFKRNLATKGIGLLSGYIDHADRNFLKGSTVTDHFRNVYCVFPKVVMYR